MQEFVLPDWWSDDLADVPANRALAEAFIARQLGFSLDELRSPEKPLSMPAIWPAQFKRRLNKVDDHVEAAALLAQVVARKVVNPVESSLPPLVTDVTAKQIRNEILRQKPFVDLDSLVDWCWDNGVLVFQLYRVPSKKNFDGLATMVEGRPVIVLASGKDSPAWLVFHLAHELGHLAAGHVGDEPLLESFAKEVDEGREEEADSFALELLTGFRRPGIPDLRQTGEKLALTALRTAPDQGIDPGVFALVYARLNNRYAVAQKALKYLGLHQGGQDIVASRLDAALQNGADLSEEDERLLRVLRPAA